VKRVIWLGDSLGVVRNFPVDARHETGYQLELVQAGREPADWKPMSSVGPGVLELRVHAGGAYRLLYVAKFAEAIYVLHAFQKKTRRTARNDIEAARRRLRSVMQER
jgi:phage-related protein